MHSLRSRLWVIWSLTSAASLAVGWLLIQLYLASTAAQVERAEAVVSRACDMIGDRYAFYVAGTQGGGAAPTGGGWGRDLVPVVAAGLATQRGVEGGIWSDATGSVAYAFPSYEGTGPKTDVPVAELPSIRDANQDALHEEQTVVRRSRSGTQTLLLAACPLPGPFAGLTAWSMARVQGAHGYDRLRIGLGVLLALVLGIAAWVTWLTLAWGRHVRSIEAALATHDIEDLPRLPRTGERELDRVVVALNDAGQRLSAARVRSAEMAARVAASERLAGLGQVAAGLAHEIRNPMAAMRLRAENALAGDAARLRPALEANLVQIARVDRLIAELLAMTQKRPPQREQVDLPRFLADRVAEHRDQARAAGVSLTLDTALPATACFDPELIGRALDNLLLNGLRHAPPGGSVHVGAGEDATVLRIRVSDTGSGVDPALRARLFEPFATGRPDGTGLGLAIAREIAEAHGGRAVLADGGQAGAGATFILELPRVLPCR